MITIDQWRIAIGRFYVHGKVKKFNCKTLNVFIYLFFCILFIMILLSNVNVSFLLVTKLLIDGDIECNPGPTYNIIKLVKASFHQGNTMFGETAGTQCACNALFSLCWARIKSVAYWNSCDLDYVLIKGDEIYKNINLKRFLGPEDLPNILQVENANVTIKYVQLVDTEINKHTDFIRPSFFQFSRISNGIMFFVHSSTISLLWDTKSFFLFDSHSRDEQGKCVENGTGILIKFSSLRQVQKYISENYLIERETLLCQIQYILIEIDTSQCSLTKIKKSSASNKRKLVQPEKCQENLKKRREKMHKIYTEKLGTSEHKIVLEQRNKNYAEKNGTPQHKLFLEMRRTNYDEKKGTSKHKTFLEQQKTNYFAKKDTPEHKTFLQKRKINYANKIGTPEHKNLLKKQKSYYAERQQTSSDMEVRIKKFKTIIMEGPFYFCVVCNRCMFKRSVVIFKANAYVSLNSSFYFAHVQSFNGNEYICLTCHQKLKAKKSQTPCQAVCNQLELFNLPHHLSDVNRLERVLVAKRILFKKVVIMPKGNSPKMKGAICNVPVDAEDVCNILPRPACSNGLLVLKLKRKLMYRGHVYFEPVRPHILFQLLNFLKENNPLYNNVLIDLNLVSRELLYFNDDETSDIPQFSLSRHETSNEMEEEDNPLDEHRTSSNETIMASKIPIQVHDDTVTVAPGEGQTPIPLFEDEYCEEMAFPHLFPTGKFGYKVEREIALSPVKYFNQRLLNYTQKFASDTDYIFFANYIVQQTNLRSKINIAMKKVAGNNLTAGMFGQNFKETVKNYIANDNAFNFMNTVKGTPAYWKRFLLEVLAIVKQLGVPTFFLTLSCADLRWFELPAILSKLYNLNLTEEEINSMNYQDRCRYLNMNPVFVARHFQYRVEAFFKEIVLDGSLGKVKYHVIRVEFQVRGSPHVHIFLWIVNPPVLTIETKDEYISFVDGIIRADLPNNELEPELFNLVKTYQVHTHSKTCRKYKNQSCRFNFGHFFTDRTIISTPLSNDLIENEKDIILQKRMKVLDKVKSYIDEFLFPKKRNIIDPTKDNYEEPETISEILNKLELTEEEYYNALSISRDNDHEIHLKRPPNSCFVNNYFAEGLRAWEANMDVQPVFNQNKAVTYICKYVSKSEDECSKAMKQALDEARNNNSDKFQQMLKLAKAYSSNRECSVQEAVYHVMPELWLRKTFPAVIFVNTNLPENRFRICKSEEELNELPDDSSDIFKHNMLDRYMDRPDNSFKNGKYKILNTMCLAVFMAYYYLDTKNKDQENDNQPVILNHEIMEENYTHMFPPIVPLMTSKEKVKCRKVRAVLRFHVPSRNKYPERYAHHILLLYYPFRSESELLVNTYLEKLSQPGVLDIVNQNKQNIEPFAELVDEAFEHYHADLDINMNAFAQQENEEVEDLLSNTNEELDEEPNNDAITEASRVFSDVPCVLPDNEINEKIRSLNKKQREIFDVVLSWANNFVKSKNCKNVKKINPLNIFLTGQGGCGKSHLVKTIFYALSKLLLRKGTNPDKQRVMLLAPTGVAAVNINGTTIHSGLGIYGKLYTPLSDQMRASLRNKLEEVAIVIIDEISMVSDKLFKDVHLRLCEIAGISPQIPFAGKTVLAVGDFFQLPPVMGKPVYSTSGLVEGLLKLWDNFKIAELTEVMRQQGENVNVFVDFLNHVRVAELSVQDEELLKSRFISKDSPDYPVDALHLFAENKPVLKHNEAMLEKVPGTPYLINAIDELPKNVSTSLIELAQNRKQTETGGLATKLIIKLGAKVMLTVNIDIADKLINGQIGTVKNTFKNNRVSKIYVKFFVKLV